MADDAIDCGGIDMTNATNLATTIPISETIHGVGELVFPHLRNRLWNIGCEELIPYVDERERFGIAKHGQPLRTGDGRHTPTEIMCEMLDGAVYGEKYAMQYPGDPLIEDAIAATVVAALKWLDAIKNREAWQNAQPWTQEEIDRASEKAKEYATLLETEPPNFWPGEQCPKCNNPRSLLRHGKRFKCCACGDVNEKGIR